MHRSAWLLAVWVVGSSCSHLQQLSFAAHTEWRTYDGVGALSGGGATSTFLEAYNQSQRSEILDWMFKPGYGASLNILKVEIGSDDQTTDGCEGCHMRSSGDLNCHRGYEWDIMKQAVGRQPGITLYGLPWGWPGWLGFGTTNPFTNVSATADYIGKWLECARDAHGLNVSVVGLWNEADSFWAKELNTFDYILALRQRLDASGLQHVRIVAPDGSIAAAVQTMATNGSIKAATWALGQHYPGASGTSSAERALGMPLLASEDYSTYSDATGAACWARLLTQNIGWGFGATISWYLLGAFARGMDYDSDGLIRAEWPESGHYELTPMVWSTMHVTRFSAPGWTMMPCPDATQPHHPTGRCALPQGGNYAVLLSPDGADFTVLAHTFDRNHSACIRNDPPEWVVASSQTVRFRIENVSATSDVLVQVRSCSSWRYPSDDDGYLESLADVALTSTEGTLSFSVTIDANCFYTFSTIQATHKPAVPGSTPPAQAFKLPYFDDFEGAQVGLEAPYFGDQMGKFETVPALGRSGNALRQQLGEAPWPINHPNCDHSQPISIIGDMYMSNLKVSADVLLEASNVGAGLGLRTRNPSTFWRGVAPGLYLFVGATIGISHSATHQAPGGVAPPSNVALSGWKLCSNSYCEGTALDSGALPEPWGVAAWHRLSLSVLNDVATGTMDNTTLFTIKLPSTSLLSASDQPFAGEVPPSGWAALVSTLGHVQFDSFSLEGLSQGGAAVESCRAGPPVSGEPAVLTPCDVPHTRRQWVRRSDARLQLQGTALCLGVTSTNVVQLVGCAVSNSKLLHHNQSTGQIQLGGRCVDLEPAVGGWPSVVLGVRCDALPANRQQYQYNPHTMVLRPKTGACVADFQSSVNDAYRDCCVAVCS